MKNLILATSLVFVVSAFAAGSKNAFSEFERSLMNEDNSEQSLNSTEKSTTSSDFESSLMGQSSSEMEPIYRAREDLLEAIRNKDTATVSLKVAQLEGMQTLSIIPLHDTEKLCFYKDLKMYRALLKMLIQHYKAAYNFDKTEKARYAENDGLMVYTKEYLEKHKIDVGEYDEIEPSVNRSDLTAAEKSELRMLMHLKFAYKHDHESAYVRDYATEFVEKYPDHPDVLWIKKSILAPLNRMDIGDLYFAERAEKKETVIENKLYTGGVGFNLFMLGGGLGYGDYYREDMVELESYPINFELYLQIRRVSVSFELVNSGHEGVMDLGFSVGFVAYDSRYLKIRPYLQFAGCIINGTIKRPFYDFSSDDYFRLEYNGLRAGESYESPETSTAVTIGANVDFKFGTAYLFLSNSKLTSFSIVGKFGLSYMDLENSAPVTRGSGFDAFFAIGLGIYFW